MSRSRRWALAWVGVFVVALSSTLIATSTGVIAGKATRGHSCAIEDDAFVTIDGGCKDLVTGLVWGTRNMGHGGAGWGWRSAHHLTDDSSEAGHDEWRLPTVTEFQGVLANGAATHFRGGHVLDRDLNYWTDDKSGSRRMAVNSTTRTAADYMAETAFYFIGVRNAPDPEPEP